jgi:hypothetical protein
MFYRRKIILALLETFDNELEKIKFQKLLFLIGKQQEKPEYDFIPYKFGCYSFSANADIIAMAGKGMLSETDKTIKKEEPIKYLSALKPTDRNIILTLKKIYGKYSVNDLIKYTYVRYPFWAIKSQIKESILNKEELQNVMDKIPTDNDITLFTIGYEGISLEAYLLKLVRNNVKVLIDVRRNPLSMKFGFSKSSLQMYCNLLGIEYIHYPEVGINSEERQELNTQADYDALFDRYKKSTLPNTTPTQDKIFNLLVNKRRIALTCFEHNICQCHRKHLAEAITQHKDFIYQLKHI